MVLPEVLQALMVLNQVTEKAGVPSKTIGLVQIRASQINACSVCVDMHFTRLSDLPDPVPDSVWREARSHYDERALAALITSIALINTWNRLNVATRQVAGEWAESAEAEKVRSNGR